MRDLIYEQSIMNTLVPRHCMHNNQRFNDGEKWHPDKCTTCICKEGLTFCHVHQCSPIAGCNHFVIPEGECCPVCAGRCLMVKSEKNEQVLVLKLMQLFLVS